ncbi:MAG: hypothetical protein EGR45_07440 [Ruminococcaceae bacterium]|nr:hypothetical protein [Oscillospiraceae bacterium]
MSEEIKSVEEERAPEKKRRTKEDILEIIIAIFLGVTALATAWASWIGSLHGGNMSTNYTKSNNLAADGNARWNEASQSLMQDMQVWNMISDYQVEILYASGIGDSDKMYENAYKIKFICADNLTQEMADIIAYDFNYDADQIITWVEEDERATTSPFADEDYVNSYYEDAQAVLAESEAVLAEGQQDNTRGDTFNLVTVIYSVVLFMLGIVGTFRRLPNRMLITCVAIAGFLFGTIYMFTIPFPTGFNFLSFFGG